MSDPPVQFPKPLKRTRLYEQVAEQISAWIVDSRFCEGDRLPEIIETCDPLETKLAALAIQETRIESLFQPGR